MNDTQNDISQETSTIPALSFPVTINDLLNGALFFALVSLVVLILLRSGNPNILWILLIFMFYEIGVFRFRFLDEGVVLYYFYGRKRHIMKEQIVRIAVKDTIFGRKIEINWKKSSRHSTRVFRISSWGLKKQNLTADSLVMFLKERYNK